MLKRTITLIVSIFIFFALAMLMFSCGSNEKPSDEIVQTESNISVEDTYGEHVHSGGSATCQTLAVCKECGQEYGEKNSNNHVGTAEWIKNATVHKKSYSCCGAVAVAEAEHLFENGDCLECGYACTHSGGTATCEKKAVCQVCSEEYGELGMHTASADFETNPGCSGDHVCGNVQHRRIGSGQFDFPLRRGWKSRDHVRSAGQREIEICGRV